MRPASRVTALLLAAALALPGLAACGGSGKKKGETLTVFAASSLSEPFTTLGKEFEKAHPGVKVRFEFGPSSGLAQQISAGAPGGVFASASTGTMDPLVTSGDAKDPKSFATNTMEIATPPADPGHVASLKDLARPGVRLAVCQAQVPCGKTAAEVLTKAGLKVKPATEEVDVKSVLTKVVLGEVDAGMVYVTDVKAAGSKVRGVPIPAAQNATTSYPIAVLSHAKHAKPAAEFVALVLSSAGSTVLRQAGFTGP